MTLSELIYSNTLFHAVGIAKIQPLEKEVSILKEWIDSEYYGVMDYIPRRFEQRKNPEMLQENVKSVVVCLLNYRPPIFQSSDEPQIAKNSYNKDYHQIVKERLFTLMSSIKEWGRERGEEINGRFFCDTAPVLEKSWAVKAGLGWIGKNTLLINPKYGSYTVLGVILLDYEIETTPVEIEEQCGKCTLCVDTCPTSALLGNNTMDARKCTSYLTIENKPKRVPIEQIRANLGDYKVINNYVFGCDICQDICPFNQQTPATDIEDFISK